MNVFSALSPLGFDIDLDDQEGCDEVCSDCAKRYLKLAHGKNGKKTALDWLAEAAYQLIGFALEDEEQWENLVGRIERFGRRVRGEKGAPTQFQLGLLAIFAHVEPWRWPKPSAGNPKPDRGPWPTSAERRRLGCQLQYAYDHMIPPLFLKAFLYEVGVAAAEAYPNTRMIAPKYKAWIIEQLASPQVIAAKAHRYPRSVQIAARARMDGQREAKARVAAVYYRAANGFPEPKHFDWDKEPAVLLDPFDEELKDILASMFERSGRMPSHVSQAGETDDDDDDFDWDS